MFTHGLLLEEEYQVEFPHILINNFFSSIRLKHIFKNLISNLEISLLLFSMQDLNLHSK